MRRRLTTALFLLFSAALLTACTDRQLVTDVRVERPKVPESLFQGPPDPVWQGGTAKALSLFLAEVKARHQECLDKMDQLHGLVNKPPEPAPAPAPPKKSWWRFGL